MLLFALFVFLCLTLLLYLIILPAIDYFRDPKKLRQYPNYSWLSAISDLPYCYLSACGFRSRDLTNLHKDKPIIRIGPNNLSFGHVDAIKDIYGHSTTCVKDLKYAITASEHPNLFDVTDKPKHAEKRKRFAAAFAIKNLEAWEFKVVLSTQRLLKVFDAHCNKSKTDDQPSDDLTVDVNHWINLFTIEAVNNIALSNDLGLLHQGTDVVTAERLDGSTYKAQYRKSQNSAAYATSHFVWDYKNYRLLVSLSKLFPSWRAIWKEAEPFQDIVYHQAATRLRRYEEGEVLDDFFSAMMDDKSGRPYGLEWGEIVSDVHAILDAGADTTAIALTQVLDLLIQHPKHMETLREEIGGVLNPEDGVAPYDVVKNLPFLRACLDEALRLIPPTSAGLPRRTPPEGTRILDKWIAGNTSVSMTAYTAHHDSSVFPNPEEFQPHRWMDPAERRRMESYFIPFSTGARGCLGRNISYLEQTVVLATLVNRYDFALANPECALQRFEAFNLLVGRLPVRIWRRAIEGSECESLT